MQGRAQRLWAGRGARGRAGRGEGLIPSAQQPGGYSWTSIQWEKKGQAGDAC